MPDLSSTVCSASLLSRGGLKVHHPSRMASYHLFFRSPDGICTIVNRFSSNIDYDVGGGAALIPSLSLTLHLSLSLSLALSPWLLPERRKELDA